MRVHACARAVALGPPSRALFDLQGCQRHTCLPGAPEQPHWQGACHEWCSVIMQEEDGVVPDGRIYVGMVHGCTNQGRIDEARWLFAAAQQQPPSLHLHNALVKAECVAANFEEVGPTSPPPPFPSNVCQGHVRGCQLCNDMLTHECVAADFVEAGLKSTHIPSPPPPFSF